MQKHSAPFTEQTAGQYLPLILGAVSTQLPSLTVDEVKIDASTISTLTSNLVISPTGGNSNMIGSLSVNNINIEQSGNPIAGATYTLVAEDNRRLLIFDNSSAVTVTLPQQSTLTTNSSFSCKFLNLGAGTVTFIKEGAELIVGNITAETNSGGRIERPLISRWAISGGTSIVNNTGLSSKSKDITTSQTKTYFLAQANADLLGISFDTFSIGTAGTFKLQLNGVDIAGLTGLVPSTSVTVGSVSTAISLVAGDKITVVADGTLANIVDLDITLNFTETF
jgi:hypothetical protein